MNFSEIAALLTTTDLMIRYGFEALDRQSYIAAHKLYETANVLYSAIPALNEGEKFSFFEPSKTYVLERLTELMAQVERYSPDPPTIGPSEEDNEAMIRGNVQRILDEALGKQGRRKP